MSERNPFANELLVTERAFRDQGAYEKIRISSMVLDRFPDAMMLPLLRASRELSEDVKRADQMLILSAAAHVMLSINPDISGRLSLEAENLLHEASKVPDV